MEKRKAKYHNNSTLLRVSITRDEVQSLCLYAASKGVSMSKLLGGMVRRILSRNAIRKPEAGTEAGGLDG